MNDILLSQCLWIIFVVIAWIFGYLSGRRRYYQACKQAVKQREMNNEIAREILDDSNLLINVKIGVLKLLFAKDKR